MKAIHGGKAKNDRIDSFKIVNLIRGGNFPLAYVYKASLKLVKYTISTASNAFRTLFPIVAW